MQRLFERADIGVRLLDHCLVQTFLAAEVVIQHPLRRIGALGDSVNPCTAQTHRRELLCGDVNNVSFRLFRVVLSFGVRRLDRTNRRCDFACLFHHLLCRAPWGGKDFSMSIWALIAWEFSAQSLVSRGFAEVSLYFHSILHTPAARPHKESNDSQAIHSAVWVGPQLDVQTSLHPVRSRVHRVIERHRAKRACPAAISRTSAAAGPSRSATAIAAKS